MANPQVSRWLPVLLAITTAVGSLLALTGTLGTARWQPAALWHLVFAMGALPLVLAAMGYFAPVLTRTPEAPRLLTLIPLAALTAGVGIVGWFLSAWPVLRLTAPWLALATTVAMTAWLIGRWRACLGHPHPCLRWYLAALGCLSLGLAAIAVAPLWPDQTHGLRGFHLHLNILGFLGLTAIGTLQVLMPTVLGQPDAGAPRRLTGDLPWSLGGAMAIAAGAAWWSPLAMVGAAAYAWPLLRLGIAVTSTFGRRLWAPAQPAPLLLAAMVGLLACLGHGVVHGLGAGLARDALPLFLIGFLLPLVSGAVTQLVPVWLRPGAPIPWQRGERQRLSALARLRALLLLAGGSLAALGQSAGYGLGIAGALWLAAALILAVLRRR